MTVNGVITFESIGFTDIDIIDLNSHQPARVASREEPPSWPEEAKGTECRDLLEGSYRIYCLDINYL